VCRAHDFGQSYEKNRERLKKVSINTHKTSLAFVSAALRLQKLNF